MTSAMMHYNQGDVILIPFPFTDFTTHKQRPAVIFSCNAYNRSHKDVIICAITSHVPDRLEPFDYKLSREDMVNAGLPQISIIKLDKIITVDKRLIRKTLGLISSKTTKEAIKLFNHIFYDS